MPSAPQPPREPPPIPRGRVLILVVVMAALQLTTRLLPPSDVPVSVCLVRNITGFPCPSCGMSRGFNAMARWSPVEAFDFNIAAPLVYPASWLLLVLGLVDLTARPGLVDRLWRRVKRPVFWGVVALMAASWLINLTEHLQKHSVGESLAGSLLVRALRAVASLF